MSIGRLTVVLVAAILMSVPASAASILVRENSSEGSFANLGLGRSDFGLLQADLEALAGEPLGGFADFVDALTDTLPQPLTTYDALWVDLGPSAGGLSAQEMADIQTFAATGRPVVLMGDADFLATWNTEILATVGGTYQGAGTTGTQPKLFDHPLTAGVADLVVQGVGLADAGTATPQHLFDAGGPHGVVSLWGGNVLTLLDAGAISNSSASFPNNVQFRMNLAAWTLSNSIVPEPSTWAGLLLGVAGFLVYRRARRHP